MLSKTSLKLWKSTFSFSLKFMFIAPSFFSFSHLFFSYIYFHAFKFVKERGSCEEIVEVKFLWCNFQTLFTLKIVTFELPQMTFKKKSFTTLDFHKKRSYALTNFTQIIYLMEIRFPFSFLHNLILEDCSAIQTKTQRV